MFSASNTNQAPLSSIDELGNTALHLAVQKHANDQASSDAFAFEVSQLILSKINVSQRNHADERALDIAIKHKAVRVIQTLLVFEGVTLGDTEEEVGTTLAAIRKLPMLAGSDLTAQKHNALVNACIRYAVEKVLPKVPSSVLFSPRNSTPALHETPTTPSLKR